MVIHFNKAVFVKTAVAPKGYPDIKDAAGHALPEIAVAGRSNVGKSSLLNHLFQVKNLVKTSSVPGKTQHINFFNVNDQMVFVDLPGYGYAQVPDKVRAQWGPMVQTYLEKRESLKLIFFLFDIRRMPNDEDRQFIEWVAHYQKSMILVLTKVDKVTTNEKKANTAKILKEFNVDNLYYIHYSTTKNMGRLELIKMLIDALADEQAE
jgi:GTP-binding protein